ncbi:MAG: baseplate J/gp47 family protein [Zymomonas mobilis]|uniref:baseplate assembly protein n=1 Tax=Zymomonas mobilis TaxID=542 RepID=UPI0039E74094
MAQQQYQNANLSQIDLSQLPAPTIIEQLDFETIYQQQLANFRADNPQFTDADIVESDVCAKILQTTSYREMLLRQRINDAVKAVLISFARGSDLEQIGARFGVYRQTITPADQINNIPAVMESDDSFLKRILLAPAGYSVAGPANAYRFHALSADGRVIDASATTPEAGTVLVSILSDEGNGTASDEILQNVNDHLTADDIRPLTDNVIVKSAEIVQFSIDATLKFYAGPSAAIVQQNATDRLNSYLSNSRKIGRDITIAALHAALTVEGIQNVILNSPTTDIVISDTQAGYCQSINITNGGIAE